jgi:hypothetical protein
MQKRFKISAEANYSLGSSVHLDSSQGSFKVVFRDQGGEAYFSCADASGVLDRVAIYNRAQVPSTSGNFTTQIVWSPTGGQALLLVNQQPQAVFDFIARRGYCRTNAPAPSRAQWAVGHEWSEDALRFF